MKRKLVKFGSIAALVNLLSFTVSLQSLNAQIITAEDSLNAGLTRKTQSTYVSGYGEAVVSFDTQLQTATASLRRNILFVGHKFNDKIQFFSEMELENAAIFSSNATSTGGELAMEQLFLKFNANRNHYFVAGLFIPRIGMINENHLPTTFSTNDRPYVEQFVIPSTWRELGIGYYGNIASIPGLNVSCALVNGLNSARFVSGSGLREGRQGGQNATASNVAMTGALLYYFKDWRFQMSGYYGGSAGLSKREADSLQMSYGAFGTPVALVESNVQYLSKIGHVKALATVVDIADADAINRAYANNTPKQMIGCYVEAGLNLLALFNNDWDERLNLFGRYEWMDMNAVIPENGITNGVLKKRYIIGGLHFQPVRGVSLKLDYVHRITDAPNEALWVSPFPQALPYFTSNGFVNLGMGYSF